MRVSFTCHASLPCLFFLSFPLIEACHRTEAALLTELIKICHVSKCSGRKINSTEVQTYRAMQLICHKVLYFMFREISRSDGHHCSYVQPRQALKTWTEYGYKTTVLIIKATHAALPLIHPLLLIDRYTYYSKPFQQQLFLDVSLDFAALPCQSQTFQNIHLSHQPCHHVKSRHQSCCE